MPSLEPDYTQMGMKKDDTNMDDNPNNQNDNLGTSARVRYTY